MFSFAILPRKAIKTSVYRVETPKLIGESSVKIVHLSDLHSTIYGNNQDVLIEKIIEQRPDLIVFTGDIIDDKIPVAGATLLLEGIHGIAPFYYVMGNHEYRSMNIQATKNALESYGVIVLSGRYERIMIQGNELIVAGLEDPLKKRYEDPAYNQIDTMKRVFTELNDMSSYKLLLAHRPEYIKYYRDYSFDLVLSGHAHGGQVRIPHILNGLYAPNQGLFPKYAGGLYKHGALTHIVSRGLSYYPMLPRIFNPPELVVIELASSLK